MKFLFCCCLNAIAILPALPLTAQELPKFCGTEFRFQGQSYCVKTLASSAEETIIEIVTPQFKILEDTISGLEYRQYQLLTTCDNPHENADENPQSSFNENSLFLIQLRYLDSNGKVMVPNATTTPKKPVNYDQDLAWTAYQITCTPRSGSLRNRPDVRETVLSD
jgi:hypothetical protein